MKFSIAIPARLGSTRLPGKVLADLGGKPVLRHVWEAANRVNGANEVVVLTESPEVQDVVKNWGGICYLTPESCNNGTERVCSALDRLSGDLIFNIQSDEPFLRAELIEAMIARASMNGVFDILTPVYSIKNADDIFNPNVVKVVLGHAEQALYFSRSPIPYVRSTDMSQWLFRVPFFGHLGIYLYGREVLEQLNLIPPSPLAAAESLEQLRFLQAGRRIQTILTDEASIAIDTPEDLARARKVIRESAIP
ncbi:MAG: 3-deoxy-manno-octulosonate cytidylyltransferase [Puniceicoccales bacterium]|jgi:3-deoxy-manno-octulosonate cytidylyltransferase (CMP-KDO synthetase)|nr:3-deoxy-manno-octulosonate cytidylyltransferase [Puniceicoccales bacterium]